ncbi:hypothetical protein J4440_06685 [Candidatus Woesearchaeota archaeon]|nr:hypothetical protein [Candidatus Woesearchaeota archaeon]
MDLENKDVTYIVKSADELKELENLVRELPIKFKCDENWKNVYNNIVLIFDYSQDNSFFIYVNTGMEEVILNYVQLYNDIELSDNAEREVKIEEETDITLKLNYLNKDNLEMYVYITAWDGIII